MARGRPRSFDTEEAIEKAMVVFWSKGYEGTTIPDLTEAIGINRPSLYAAFGSKEGLFRLALDRYRKDPASYVNRALAQPTAREVFESLLNGVIDLVTDPENPGGCLFVCAALPISDESEPIKDELAKRRIAGERDILKRFARAAKENDLPPDVDPKSLAKFAATMIWGLSIQGTNGSTKKEMRRVAKLAMMSFDAWTQKKKTSEGPPEVHKTAN